MIVQNLRYVGGAGQGFCDNSTKASAIKKRDDGRRKIKKCSKLRDVIYGRPLNVI
jgi:hypothetical protein